MIDMIFWFIFIVSMVVTVVIVLFVVRFAFSSLRGVAGTMSNGVPSTATIRSVAETGWTVSSPWTGPDAAVFRIGLLVNPVSGGAPYEVEARQSVPRVARPMIVPGATVGVLVDPLNPGHVDIDWQNLGGAAAVTGTAFVGMPPGGVAPPGGFTMSFDADGRPTGDLDAVVAGVHGGTMNTISGSANQLLATGTAGTAVITTAQPLGKLVRDVNPNAAPDRLNFPMWLFTVEVTLPGQAPFPAIFGHYVPDHRVALLAPGVKLAVAVNEADRHQDVAIDWDRSPLPPGT